MLPDLRFLRVERCFLERCVEDREILRAMPAERVDCAGAHEGFEDALVAEAEVDPSAEVEDRLERLLGTGRDDAVDRAAPDIADRAESEADFLLTDDREL